jgi:para-nitrobenzyl esterase
MERYGAHTLAQLRALPAEKIVGEMETQHHVTIDGTVLTDLPYNLRKNGVHNETALLHGFNLRESGPFILFDRANLKNYESKVREYFGTAADEVLALYSPKSDEEADQYWAEVYGALYFNYSHDCLHRLMKDLEPVYQYRFSKDNKRLSNWHSGELPYVFGVIPDSSPLYDESDRNLSALMHQYWVSFAKTGNPDGKDRPEFPRDADHLMEFDRNSGPIENPYRSLYDILDRKTGFTSEGKNETGSGT